MGKDQITEQPLLTVRNLIKRKAPMPATAANGIPAKPVMPMQASGNHQSLRIEIQPGSFQELFAYDGLKFEVINENAYLRTDANEEWEDVKLDRGPEEGTYIVTFTNAKRKVSYKVRPVLEGKDYEAALKIFNEKNKAYELALKNRLTNEKISDSINSKNKQLQMMADNEANNRIRALIIARNKRIIEEKQRRDLAVQESEIIRTFPITNFGVWNCDQPGVPNYIPVFAKYKNSAGDELSIQYAVTIYKNYNGYMPSPVPQTVRVVPGQDNMIWGIQDSVFYYFTYKDFAAANIQRDTRSFEFIMRRAGKKISSYAEIKELAEKL